jgi:hypothetical protein
VSDVRQAEPEIVDGVDLTPGVHQDARGVDLTLIRHCLALTPAERLAENEGVIELIRLGEQSRNGAR